MSKGEGRSRKKCLAYVAAFLVFQAAVILILALTVLKVKNPKVRFNAMAVESFASNNATSTSINMKLLAQLTIKNTNFGQFKYDNATLVVLYNGVPLGEAVILKGRTKERKTQKFNIGVDVSTERVIRARYSYLYHEHPNTNLNDSRGLSPSITPENCARTEKKKENAARKIGFFSFIMILKP